MNLNDSRWIDHGAWDRMNETRRCALEQLRALLEGTGESGSSPSGTEEALLAPPSGAQALYLMQARFVGAFDKLS